MKKVVLLIAAVVLSFGAIAQGIIPNGYFEFFTLNTGGLYIPDSCKNIAASPNDYSDSSAFRDNYAHNGFQSLAMMTNAGEAPFNSLVFPGFVAVSLANIAVNVSPFSITGGGFPFASRPDSIKGWYTYDPAPAGAGGVDTFSVQVVLSKWNTSSVPPKRDTVAWSNFRSSTASVGWSAFGDTLHYMPLYNFPALPDTCIIMIFSSPINPQTLPPQICLPSHDGTYLRMDDLSFAGTDSTGFIDGISKSNSSKPISVFPNPASKEVNFSFTGSGNGTLILSNILGERVAEIKVDRPVVKADVSRFENGLYIYRFNPSDKSESKTGRFVISK